VLATPGDRLFILDDRVTHIAEREMQMALHDDSGFCRISEGGGPVG